jgi:hypothetical protein
MKGPVPSLREEALFSVADRLSPFRGKRASERLAYIVAVRAVFFPKPISPAPIRRRDSVRLRRRRLLPIMILFDVV